MSTTTITLDVGRFEALAALQEEGKPDVLAEMVGLFVGEAEGWLTEARDAVEGGDVAVLSRVAHSLKGSCATIGADEMRALANKLEEVLAGGRLSEIGPLVKALTEEFARVRTLLDLYAGGGQMQVEAVMESTD